MPSALDVCQLALARVGSRTPITSLDENAPEAFYCKTFYQMAVNAAFADNDWRFATAYALLAREGTAPPQWAYQYAQPKGCMRARAVVSSTSAAGATPSVYVGMPGQNSADTQPTVGFTTASGLDAQGALIPVIWTNLASAGLIFTARQDNPDGWEPMFLDVVTWRLAMNIAVPLTGNGAILSAMAQGHAQAVAEAAATSASSGTVVDSHTPDWLTVRGLYDYTSAQPLLQA